MKHRFTISEEVKFMRVSIATFHDNKQALYGIFQYVLATTTPQAKFKLSSSQHMHINLLTVKILDIRAFLGIISGHKF